jgi:hypothetical protein
MESLLVAAPRLLPVGPSWALVIVIAVTFVLLLVGYTIGARYLGFGPHDVKTIHTFEYVGDDARKEAPKQEGQPQKRIITTETQTGRTFWDWMAFLTISAAVAGVALYFTFYQAEEQRLLQEEEAMETSMQTYLDQMTQMILDDNKPLLKSGPNSVLRQTARVRTVTALNRLDGEHNKIVIDFLKDSGLIGFRVPGEKKESVVRLDAADLDDVDFAHSNLGGVNLRFAELRHADLHNAILGLSNLTFADLAHANLESADLRDTDLIFANLEDAKLADANFSGARLRGVDLSGANLKKARNLTQVQIDQAGAGGTGTKLPEGIEPPDWWSYSNATVEPPEKNSLAYPRLQDDRLGASLAPLGKNLNEEVGSEIGLPKDVGISEHGASGALVYDVQPRSLANAAGLQPGDIIVTMGEKKPRGLEDLKGKLHRHLDKETDSQVQFTIRRWFFEKGWRQGVVNANIGDQ